MPVDRGTPPSDPGDGEPAGGHGPGTCQGRRGRRGRILAWTSGVLTAVLTAGAVTVYLGYRHLDGNIRVRNVQHLVGSQPADLHPRAQNIAVIGSDSRAGAGSAYGNPAVYTVAHSDTLMIVHIAADRKWAQVVSIPRDSWVHIPSCDMGDGQRSSPTDSKINEAFTLGSLHGDAASGAACTIRTLEQDTGVRIDHFVVVSFTGFKYMVDALGGVQVCTRQPIADPLAKLYLPAGRSMLDGNQALGFVRARYSLGDGSDIERIARQQAFMSSLARRARSELYDPLAIYHFLDAATRSLTIDSGLGGIPGLYGLASSLKNLPPDKLTFLTVPTYPRELIDPADTANVMWQQPDSGDVFASLRQDVPLQQVRLAREQAAAGHATPAAASPLGRTMAWARPGGMATPGTGPAAATPAATPAARPAAGTGAATPGTATARAASQNICV